MKRIIELKQYIKAELTATFSNREVETLCKSLFAFYLNYSSTDYLLNDAQTVDKLKEYEILNAVNRLKNHEPLSYITGEAYFYNQRLTVNSSVLIPRPETEELVSWIISDWKDKSNLSVLDICTGSGCIALSLDTNLNCTRCEGWDISAEALEVAKTNASNLKSNCIFVLNDVFSPQGQSTQYDVIVSNPPYVKESEKELMHKNVLDFEPHIALFVKDNDPLVFYEQIADIALNHLKPNGNLYFEINEALGQETANMLKSKGFTNIEVRNDYNDKARMVKCTAASF